MAVGLVGFSSKGQGEKGQSKQTMCPNMAGYAVNGQAVNGKFVAVARMAGNEVQIYTKSGRE